MGKASKHSKPALPKRLMENIYWSFSGNAFADRPAFEQAVEAYQHQIAGSSAWRPDATVLPVPQVRVVYEGVENDNEVEPVVVLSADDGVAFTAGELLFKLHNIVVPHLRESDHHFFEGLVRHSR